MPDTNDSSNDYQYHPIVIGADTADAQAGTMASLSDAITKGVPAAAISGVLGIANTMLDMGNKEKFDVGETIRKFDEGAGDYYDQHQSGVDLVGFVGASLVPGSWSIKAARAVGAAEGAGVIGRGLSLAATKKAYYLEEALKETAQGGGVIKSMLSVNRRKQLGWEFADQALMASAAEIGIAATMHDSTVFDNATAGDFAWNMVLGTVAGGVLGGALGSMGAKGILKSARKEIQGAMREVDVVNPHGDLGLTKGTELLAFAESIAKLPQRFDDMTFNYRVDGKARSMELPVSDALKSAQDKTLRKAYDNLAIQFNTLAGGNATTGQAFFDFIMEAQSASRAMGRTGDEVISDIAGQLANLQKVGHVDLAEAALDARKFYVNLSPAAGAADSKDAFLSLLSTKPGKGFGRQAYQLADDVTAGALRIEKYADLQTPNLATAFKFNKGIDAVQLPDGSLRINPFSKNILKIKEDPNRVKMFIDLETGTHTPETIATFGDVITKNGITRGEDFISAGTKRTTFQMPAAAVADFTVSPLQASARFAWAADKNIAEIVRLTGNRVDLDDLPILQRLVELEPKIAEATLEKMKFIDNGKEIPFAQVPSLQSLAEVKRLEILERELTRFSDGSLGSVPDLRAMAAHLNVSREWVQDAIARDFQLPTSGQQAKGVVLPTADALRPKTVQAEWSFEKIRGAMTPEEAYNMNMGPSHLASKELTRQYQIEIRQQVNREAAKSVLGADDALIHDLNSLSRDTDIGGAGATTLGASNAGYGEKAKLFVQDTGKNVALISQRWRDAVVETLSPHINRLRDSLEDSAELGIVTNALRSNPNKFVFNPANPKQLISTEVRDAMRAGATVDDAARALTDAGSKHAHTYDIGSDAVADFLRASTGINATRQGKFTTLLNAAGLTRKITDDIVYAPPINTTKYSNHAIVRTKEKIGVGSDNAMIVAHSEEQLRELVGKVDKDKFDVLFKGNTDDWYKRLGEYDYSLGINDARVNSELARTGALHDFFPETRFKNIAEDWLEWHAKQEEKLVRTAVEVKNRQFFSEVNHLSEVYRLEAESTARGIGSKAKGKIADPFGDYIKTALNISKQQEIPLLDSLNDFVDKVSLKAGDALEKAFHDARKQTVSWEEANRISAKYGMGTPYMDEATYFTANARYPQNIVRTALQKANLWLATTTLRLDFANSLVNIISTPILLGTEMQSIKGLVANDSALAGKLRELTSLQVPGQPFRMPSTVQLAGKGISNFFGANKQALMERYRKIGAVKEVTQLYHEVLDDLSFRSTLSPSQFADKVSAAVEKGAKITGNTFAEDFTRFISADVMRQLSDPVVAAGKMTVREQDAYISTFVNRVQGNYTTSQRPIVFQGTTGAAVSLFQTYAFNVLQQLHRHMEAGDKKSLAVFGGLQSTVFGFNGLPFFDAVNTHLIGSWMAGNKEHNDAYSVLPGFNKELGDWMLYGTASAMPLFAGSSPALYTRGDINPRHVTILPVYPQDVPAVQAATKLATTVWNFGKNVAGGADVSDAMLAGLEHQGLNRPLAGFAQLLAGRTTTSKGTLVSAANEMQSTSYLGALAQRTVSVEGVSRLLGARPMDEAIALNNLYRNKTYEALDKSRIERLGTVVKTKLYGGDSPTQEEMDDFMLRYTRSGGRAESFNSFMLRATRDSNVSIINQTMAKTNTPYGKKLKTIMGGEQVRDYTNHLPADNSADSADGN